MERVFIYVFTVISVSQSVIRGFRKNNGMDAGEWIMRSLCVILASAVMFLDDYCLDDGIPASLLASDMLYLDALIIHDARFQADRRRTSIFFLLLILAGLFRTVAEISGMDFPLDATAYMSIVSGLMLSYMVVEELVRIIPSGRLKGIIPEHTAFVLLKMAGAQGLALLCISILAVKDFCGAGARIFFLAVFLLLALVYAYIQSTLSGGTPVFRLIPIAASGPARQASKEEERAVEEYKRMDVLFERVEAYMKKEKPYLDDMFTMTRLAAEMMTNKSMLSKTINEKSGEHFCRYVNAYRIRHALSLMERDSRLRVGEISMMSGFHSVASFNMAFKQIMNDTPSEYMRTLHASGLHQARRPPERKDQSS